MYIRMYIYVYICGVCCACTTNDRVNAQQTNQMSQFEFFELILLLRLDKAFPFKQFEATVSQSTVPSPHTNKHDM